MNSALWLLIACGGGDGIDFPDRLVPLEVHNLADWPTGAEPFPETLSLAAGDDRDADRFWAHARGYVHGELPQVWAALRTLEVNVDRREVDSWSVTFDTVPQFDVSYTLHNAVDDVISVSYDTTWVHEAQAGVEGSELRVVARWDKTDGTPFIDLLAGSVELEQVAPGVTSIALQEHLRATLRDEQTIAGYLSDLFDETVLTTHGEPLPNYP